ncbi:MAG TPA: rhomboid family intramembrane serine protease [Longimicrobium sp.]|jgi:membrane associated rhomboid family serine protease
MAYRSSYDAPLRTSITPWVARLLTANTAIFIVVLLLSKTSAGDTVIDALMLNRERLVTRPWTVITYAFTHKEFLHFIFNMLGLFFLGPPLEDRWGGRAFLRFYLIAAVGGAIFSLFVPGSVLGASAAINGLLLAWALIWPEAQIYLFGVIPVKVKWLALAAVLMSLFNAAGSGAGDGVAHFAHLGGLVAAFLYLKSPWAPSEWGELPRAAGAKKKKENPVARMLSRKPAAPVAVDASTQSRPARDITPRAERELLDDVDRILDKISAQGLASLTEEERRRLDEVSRRYRTN